MCRFWPSTGEFEKLKRFVHAPREPMGEFLLESPAGTPSNVFEYHVSFTATIKDLTPLSN